MLVWAKKKKKLSRRGSVLAREMCAGSIWGRGDPIGVGYAGVEVLGGRGPRLWSPHSRSLPHLRPPLVHRCPLPLTPPDPQLTYLSFIRPHSLSVCACWTSCAFSLCLFALVGPHVPSVSPFAFVCACRCRSCCMYRCAYARAHAGPRFVCARPAHVSSVCSTLPVKAKLVFFKRKLYLPLHLTKDTYKTN
jgi:hypothetical protein